MLRAICVAVMVAALIAGCNPFRPGEPLHQTTLIEKHVVAVAGAADVAESLAKALYDGDQKASQALATSLISISDSALLLDPLTGSCYKEIAATEQEYYDALKRASALVVRAIMTQEWEQLIFAGDNLLLAEAASKTYAELVAAINPEACG